MKKIIAGIFIIIITLMQTAAFAQDGPPDPGNDPSVPINDGPPDPGGDPSVPIDGGASLLVGAAALYGIKKMKDRKAKQK